MKKSFTLIEMVVVIAILTIMTAVVYQIFTHSQKTYRIEQSQTALQMDIRAAVDEIVRQIKKASSCLSSYTNGSDTYTAVSETNSDLLILKIGSEDENGNIIQDTFDYFIFRRDPASSNILQEIVLANVNSVRKSDIRTLTQNASAFSLTYLDKNGNSLNSTFEDTSMVKVTVSGEDKIYNRINKATFSSSGKLRNF